MPSLDHPGANEATAPRKSHGAALSVLVVALLILVGVPSLVVRSKSLRAKAHPPGAAMGATPDDLLEGERIYQRNCAGCHQSKGQGKIGQYPPLAGASWLLDDKATAIRVALLGMRGPVEVEGRKYDNVMPSYGLSATDADVARVLTFVRTSWGNRAAPVTEVEVARVRASLAGRTEPWNGGAELSEARKTDPLR